MPATFAKLTKFMLSDMQLSEKEIRLVNQAMSNAVGTASFVNAPAGTTVIGLSTADSQWGAKGADLVSVNVSTLDKLIMADHISSVDFLSIDAEGKDWIITRPRPVVHP